MTERWEIITVTLECAIDLHTTVTYTQVMHFPRVVKYSPKQSYNCIFAFTTLLWAHDGVQLACVWPL